MDSNPPGTPKKVEIASGVDQSSTGAARGRSASAFLAESEKSNFAEYLNYYLKGDADLKDILPVDGNSVFSAVKNGVLLAKFIMLISPAAIDLKKFHLVPKSRFDIVDNANVVIAGAQAIGCTLTNIGVPDIMDGKPNLMLALFWILIKAHVLHEMLAASGGDWISHDDAARIKNKPYEVVAFWANEMIKRSGQTNLRPFKSLTVELQDSELLAHLLGEVDKEKINKQVILEQSDPQKRAELLLAEADKLGFRRFISPADIVQSNQKLMFIFLSQLFCKTAQLTGQPNPIGLAEVPIIGLDSIKATSSPSVSQRGLNSPSSSSSNVAGSVGPLSQVESARSGGLGGSPKTPLKAMSPSTAAAPSPTIPALPPPAGLQPALDLPPPSTVPPPAPVSAHALPPPTVVPSTPKSTGSMILPPPSALPPPNSLPPMPPVGDTAAAAAVALPPPTSLPPMAAAPTSLPPPTAIPPVAAPSALPPVNALPAVSTVPPVAIPSTPKSTSPVVPAISAVPPMAAAGVAASPPKGRMPMAALPSPKQPLVPVAPVTAAPAAAAQQTASSPTLPAAGDTLAVAAAAPLSSRSSSSTSSSPRSSSRKSEHHKDKEKDKTEKKEKKASVNLSAQATATLPLSNVPSQRASGPGMSSPAQEADLERAKVKAVSEELKKTAARADSLEALIRQRDELVATLMKDVANRDAAGDSRDAQLRDALARERMYREFAARINLKDLKTPAAKHGWVTIITEEKKRKRYAVLRAQTLYLFKTDRAEKERRNKETVWFGAAKVKPADVESKKKQTIQIEAAPLDEPMILQADSKQDFEDWLAKLTEAENGAVEERRKREKEEKERREKEIRNRRASQALTTSSGGSASSSSSSLGGSVGGQGSSSGSGSRIGLQELDEDDMELRHMIDKLDANLAALESKMAK